MAAMGDIDPETLRDAMGLLAETARIGRIRVGNRTSGARQSLPTYAQVVEIDRKLGRIIQLLEAAATK